MADNPGNSFCDRQPVCNGLLVFLMCVLISSAPLLCADTCLAVQASPGDTLRSCSQETGTGSDALRNTILQAQNFGTRSTWEKQWDTARWLEACFQEMGVKVSLQTYEYQGRSWPNVIAEIPGKSKSNQKILALAHLDSINDNKGEIEAPGGDDNGSGIAVILELARKLRNVSLDRTVQLCVFSNEEQDRAGSKAFSKAQRQAGANIKAVINLDSLGFNRPSAPIYFKAVTAFTSWEKKYKVIKLMINNYLKGFRHGNNSILVSGRQKNAKLVHATAKALALHSTGLRVRPQVKDDCG